jgi:hypothetical protein
MYLPRGFEQSPLYETMPNLCLLCNSSTRSVCRFRCFEEIVRDILVRFVAGLFYHLAFHIISPSCSVIVCYLVSDHNATDPVMQTRCVMKHKCPRTRQIPEVSMIVKTQGQDFKIYGSNIKVLSQGTCIWNTKALSLTIQKIWTKWKFLKSGSNFKVKVTRSKITVPLERSCHKEHTYEISKPYHLPFKRYGQC